MSSQFTGTGGRIAAPAPRSALRNFTGTILPGLNFVTFRDLLAMFTGEHLDMNHVTGTGLLRYGAAWSRAPFRDRFEDYDPSAAAGDQSGNGYQGDIAGDLDGQGPWTVATSPAVAGMFNWAVSETGVLDMVLSARFAPTGANTGNVSIATATLTAEDDRALSLVPATDRFSFRGWFTLNAAGAGDGGSLDFRLTTTGGVQAFRLKFTSDGALNIVDNGGTTAYAAAFTAGNTIAFHVSGTGAGTFNVHLRDVTANGAWTLIVAGATFIAGATPLTVGVFSCEVLNAASVLPVAVVDELEVGFTNLRTQGIQVPDGTGIMKVAVEGTRLLNLDEWALAPDSATVANATVEVVAAGE